MILDPDCTIIHRSPYATMPKPAGPEILMVGDIVKLTCGEDAAPYLTGTITEVFKGDRYKVEVTDIDGAVYRYSVPRDLMRLIRRADA